MKYKEYIVKSKEEEYGEEYWVVKVPSYVPESEVYAAFDKASKYTKCMEYGLTEEKGIAQYDEHYNEMLVTEAFTGNGIERFNYYIKEICGWEVSALVEDFEYEW